MGLMDGLEPDFTVKAVLVGEEIDVAIAVSSG
jgi:hypothetical protein